MNEKGGEINATEMGKSSVQRTRMLFGPRGKHAGFVVVGGKKYSEAEKKEAVEVAVLCPSSSSHEVANIKCGPFPKIF